MNTRTKHRRIHSHMREQSTARTLILMTSSSFYTVNILPYYFFLLLRSHYFHSILKNPMFRHTTIPLLQSILSDTN